MSSLLYNKAKQPIAQFIFAHGAGAGMNHAFMEDTAEQICQRNIDVIRFNFPYMEKRMKDGKRRPPDRMPKLIEHYGAVVSQVESSLPLFIGGKSMGGRVAASFAKVNRSVNGIICLGYPFHPIKKPEKLRLEPLQNIQHPVLILQGERDALGSKSEINEYNLSSCCEFRIFEDGDHDLKPRVKSGYTHSQHLSEAVERIVEFINENS